MSSAVLVVDWGCLWWDLCYLSALLVSYRSEARDLFYSFWYPHSMSQLAAPDYVMWPTRHGPSLSVHSSWRRRCTIPAVLWGWISMYDCLWTVGSEPSVQSPHVPLVAVPVHTSTMISHDYHTQCSQCKWYSMTVEESSLALHERCWNEYTLEAVEMASLP